MKKQKQKASAIPENSLPLSVPVGRSVLITLEPSALSHEEEILVGQYMATFSDDYVSKVAHVAASMAPAPAKFDPETLIAQAISLTEAATTAQYTQRKKLLAAASISVLTFLESGLRKKYGDASQFYLDPVLAAKEALPWRVASKMVQNLVNADEELLSRIESDDQVQRPELPCSFERAVRWAFNADSSTKWPILERAIFDSDCILVAKQCLANVESNGIQAAAVASLKLPDICRAEQEMHERTLAEIDSLRNFVEKFRPPGNPPPWIAKQIKASLQIHHQTPYLASNLAAIVRCHRGFWRTHGDAYKTIHKKQSEGAAATNLARNQRNWSDDSIVALVQEFVRMFSAESRTLDTARGFEVADRIPGEPGEILGTFLNLMDQPAKQAAAGIRQVLSDANWRTPLETETGSTAGKFARKKSGRFRDTKGIDVKESIILHCLTLLGKKKSIQLA